MRGSRNAREGGRVECCFIRPSFMSDRCKGNGQVRGFVVSTYLIDTTKCKLTYRILSKHLRINQTELARMVL